MEGNLKFAIAVFVYLLLAFFFGAILAICDDEDEQDRSLEDEAQAEYLREWRKKKQKRS